MKESAKSARKEIIKLAAEKGYRNILNKDIANLEKQGYTFIEVTAALRWLTYSPQAAKYRHRRNIIKNLHKQHPEQSGCYYFCKYNVTKSRMFH